MEILSYTERTQLAKLYTEWVNRENKNIKGGIIDKDKATSVIGFLAINNFLNTNLIRKVLNAIEIN